MSNSTNKQRIEDVTARLANATLDLQNLPNLFKTEQEMRATESTAQFGDKAVVCNDFIGNCTENSVFDKVIFPSTITLPRAVTQDESASYGFNGSTGSTSSRIELDLYTDGCDIAIYTYDPSTQNTINIRYDSLDSITYTRVTDIDSVDLRSR